MPPPRRRVSYVIPPPVDPVPRLQMLSVGFPRHGSPRPLLYPSPRPFADDQPRHDTQPTHRLGVMALALDSATRLEGHPSPEGILYTGGRDGQVISWDLGLPFRRRRTTSPPRSHSNRWEWLTGMTGETWEDDAEEERRDGDILGDVKESGRRWRDRNTARDELPYEHQWELDLDAHEFDTRTHFRQCVQMHTDWVNDILLCNYNQTVISASSDGTVKMWNPHSAPPTEPSTIGLHADYVRCLALSRERNWVASGSFDRTVKLWDLTRSSSTPEPLVTLNPPDITASKASVYSLAVDTFGHIIASGSPERVVRMWDPRAGKRVGKLVGHTDNIRAILISEDAKYLLTGAADASIKLWSLSSQRCLHTFTYHTDSVWALHSSDPSLEVFYSGDKSGIVCKVDVQDCADIADGTCIVLFRDSDSNSGEGVNKIVTTNDGLLWTASGSSSVSRWKLPRRVQLRTAEEGDIPTSDPSASTMRRMRMSPGTEPVWSHQGRGDELRSYPGVPLTALIRLTSPNGPYPPSPFITWGRDAEVATLYSAASVVSVPGMRQSFGAVLQPHAATVPAQGTLRNMRSLASMSNASHELPHDVRVVHELPELASEAEPYNSKPDSIIPGSHGLVRAILLNDRIHALTVDTEGEVAVWDIVRGICRGRYTKQDVWDASRCGSTDSSALSRGSGSTHGDRDRSPRAALEIVRERIEGEAVISPWSSVDTKTGVLTVHINERCFEAEIYADEAGYDDKVVSDEQRLNIGKWVLRNLFLGFIREEQRIRRRREGLGSDPNLAIHSGLHRDIAPTHIDLNGNKLAFPGRHSPSDMSHKSSLHMPIRTAIVASPFACRAIVPNLPVIAKPSALIPSMIPLSPSNTSFGPRHNPQSPLPNDRTPMPIRTQGLDVVYAGGRETDYFSPRSQRPITSNAALEGDSLGSNDLSSPTKVGPESPISTTPNTQSAGGLMGRLKNLGKGPIRRPATEITPGSPISSVPVNAKDTSTAPEEPEMKPEKTPAQIILSNPLSPPSSSEAPTINLPPDMTIMISDESYPGWKTVYRGSVSSTWADVYTLEETIPLWLLEYLLLNKTSPPLNVKLSFVLLPWPNPELGGETLPVLLNPAQSKLTASRFLRVRKLTHHVHEKLEKISTRPSSPTSTSHLEPSTPTTPSSRNHRVRPEEIYEILCNDSVLALDMTLAAVRQYFWRQSSELVMHYRLRKRLPASNDTDAPITRP